MKGKILNFNAEKGFGFILGEDNQKYFFHISNVKNPMDIQENYVVEFREHKSEKGLAAILIVVNTPLASQSKDKMLKIDNLRIRASEIKDYELSYEESEDEFGSYYTYSYDYTITIDTYTSGLKWLHFSSTSKSESEGEANKWLEYIDDELEKLI